MKISNYLSTPNLALQQDKFQAIQIVDYNICDRNKKDCLIAIFSLSSQTACMWLNSLIICFDNYPINRAILCNVWNTLEMELALLSRSTASLQLHTTSELAQYLHSCLPAYKNFYRTVQIALTITVTTADCERSFSALTRGSNPGWGRIWVRNAYLTWPYFP